MASLKYVIAFSLIMMMLACSYARSITHKKSDPKFRSERAIFSGRNKQNKELWHDEDFGDPWGPWDFEPWGFENPWYHGDDEHEDGHGKAFIQQKHKPQHKSSKIDK